MRRETCQEVLWEESTVSHTVKGHNTMRGTTKPLPSPWIIFSTLWHGRPSLSPSEPFFFSEGVLTLYSQIGDVFRFLFNLSIRCRAETRQGFSCGGLLNAGHWSGQSGREGGQQAGSQPPVRTILGKFILALAFSSVDQENMASVWAPEDCAAVGDEHYQVCLS